MTDLKAFNAVCFSLSLVLLKLFVQLSFNFYSTYTEAVHLTFAGVKIKKIEKLFR